MPLYRFYNIKKGVHFYTASEAEKNNVVAKLSSTYRLEGVAYSVSAAAVANSTPVHRFFNKKKGVHFYTADAAEKQNTIDHTLRHLQVRGNRLLSGSVTSRRRRWMRHRHVGLLGRRMDGLASIA